MSPKEFATLFQAVGNLKHRTVLMTMYAAGLRISEALVLCIPDIDRQRMSICRRHLFRVHGPIAFQAILDRSQRRFRA